MINNIILLCSEITKGMKSYGPKAFIPVGLRSNKKPFVVKQIESIIETYGKQVCIYIVIGFEKDKFSKLLDSYFPPEKYRNIHKIYHNDYETTNSAHALQLVLNNINNDALILQNGILTNYKPKNNNNSILPIIKSKNSSFGLGIIQQDNRAKYICYDLDEKWSEITYLCAKDIQIAKKICATNNTIKQKFLFELINLMIDYNVDFHTETVPCKSVLKINSYKDKV